MKLEKSWFKVASMDPCILWRCIDICLGKNIVYCYEDDGIRPPAVHFFTDSRTAKMISTRLGFY